MNESIIPFEEHRVRRVYDEATDTWYFSVVDIIQILTQQPDFQTARKYWNKLKERLAKEGSEVVTKMSPVENARAGWQNARNRRSKPRNPPAAHPIGAQPEGGADKAVAGESRLRAIAGDRRSGAFRDPRARKLAETWTLRKMDSAAHDGSGNAQ